MDLLSMLGWGVLAGLGLAVPLGAIGVLLIQESATRGWSSGASAAAGVATTDVMYAAAAAAGGAVAAPVVAAWAPWPQVIGGLILIGLAVRGLAAAFAISPSESSVGEVSGASGRRYLLFVGLTAINPATLIYFAAVMTAASVHVSAIGDGVAFVLGVGAASLGWQLVLVTVGALVRRGSSPKTRRLMPVVGHSIVAALGLAMVIGPIL